MGCTIQRVRSLLETEPLDIFAILNQLDLFQKWFDEKSKNYNVNHAQIFYDKIQNLIDNINSISKENLWREIEVIELSSTH